MTESTMQTLWNSWGSGTQPRLVNGKTVSFTPSSADNEAFLRIGEGECPIIFFEETKDYSTIKLHDDLSNNPCAKSVFDWLNNSSTVAKYIINQFSDGQVYQKYTYHLSIANISSSSGETPNGTTTPGITNNHIYTALDCEYLKSATQLSILRTMIHESLHAWMAAQLFDLYIPQD